MTAGKTDLPKKKKKIKTDSLHAGESEGICNIKGSTHADMKTILLDDTEKPVRGYYQSLTPCCVVWHKVNYEFPGIAPYQHTQLANIVQRG